MSKDPGFQRKLAAILVADVVGYSRMMEADEIGTLRRLQSIQRTCITPITAAYGGRLIKTTGDGFLLTFSSAVDAILFAVDFQKRVQAAMAAVDAAKEIVFRVGVHAGDVLSDGVDMFGDGVNVAARLETLCAPGGICMSAVVQQQLHGKIELPLVDLGEHQMKNITRAIHAFGIEARSIVLAADQSRDRPKTLWRRRHWIGLAFGILVTLAAGLGVFFGRQKTATPVAVGQDQGGRAFSIAVLPFATMNANEKADDFGDALVDNLTTDLSMQLESATVISSASAFTYRNKNVDPRQVGRELGVRYILEGSIQRFVDHLRVNVQLLDAVTAAQLWSDQFEGPLSDIRSLQDHITAGIANTLQVQLIRLEADHRKYTTNVSALDLIFRGESTMNRTFSFENFDAAEADFRRALVLDSDNTAALTDLGIILAIRVASSGPMLTEDKQKALLAEGQRLLERARDQNPRHPGVHSGLGLIYLLSGRAAEAADQYRTEIEIDHNASTSYASLGECLALLGRPEDAIPLLEESLRLNPRDPHIAYKYMDLMDVYFALKRYPEAITQGNRAYADDSRDARLLYILASVNALQGNQDEAKAKLAEARILEPGLTVGYFRRHPGSKGPVGKDLSDRFCEGLRLAGLPE